MLPSKNFIILTKLNDQIYFNSEYYKIDIKKYEYKI